MKADDLSMFRCSSSLTSVFLELNISKFEFRSLSWQAERFILSSFWEVPVHSGMHLKNDSIVLLIG